MSKIAAPYQTDSFGTAGTAKVSWTPTIGTNWTNATACTSTTCVDFVDSVKVFLWGSAADKTGEDPYKTMNTWYTTNKAALDSASIASSAQVGPWGLYADLQLNVAETSLLAYPAAVTSDPFGASSGNCAVNTSTSTGAGTASGYFPPIGSVGAAFGFGIKNKTTGASSPFLLWGSRVTTLAASGTAGTAVVEWESYDWTPSSAITDYSVAITDTIATTLSGVSAATSQTVYSATMGSKPWTTMRTCDTTKWSSATACNGVTKWAVNTGTAYTSSTSKGSKRAWIWLADANPTSAASVFGVEKDNEL